MQIGKKQDDWIRFNPTKEVGTLQMIEGDEKLKRSQWKTKAEDQVSKIQRWMNQ